MNNLNQKYMPPAEEIREWERDNKIIEAERGVKCADSKIGEYKCTVSTMHGWCCDVCLEAELLWLHNQGVHTVGSCCGHGDAGLKSILIVGVESKKKMVALGYNLTAEQPNSNKYMSYMPKTRMIYEEEQNG